MSLVSLDIISGLIEKDLCHVIFEILSFCNTSTIISCHQVNKAWNAYLTHYSLWRKLFLTRINTEKRFSELCLLNGWTEALQKSGREEWIYRNILLEANTDLCRWDKSDSISVATNSIISCFTFNQGILYYSPVTGGVFCLLSDGTTRSIIENGYSSRIMCMDVKDGMMTTGHLDGSIRCFCLKNGEHWTIKDKQEEAIVLKITFNGEGDIMALTRDGLLTCYQGFVSGPDHHASIKYSFSIDPDHSLTVLHSFRIGHISFDNTAVVHLFCSLTGQKHKSLGLLTLNETPLALEILANILIIGYKHRIDLWDLQDRKTRISKSSKICELSLKLNGSHSSLVAVRARPSCVVAIRSDKSMVVWNLIHVLQNYFEKRQYTFLPEFKVFQGSELPWGRRFEFTGNKVIFCDEKELGVIKIINFKISMIS